MRKHLGTIVITVIGIGVSSLVTWAIVKRAAKKKAIGNAMDAFMGVN